MMRARLLLAAGAGLLASFLAPSPAAEAASGRISLKVGEQTRSAYVIERYRSKRKLRPAIIVLGDAPRASTASRRGLRFQSFTQKGGVLIYAEPYGGKWNVGPDGAAASELAYLRSLIARVRRDSLADVRRIHIVGVGSGGIVALQAACKEARMFAGVAAALTSLPKDQPAACAPGKPLNALLIAGDADKQAPFEGGAANLTSFKGDLAPVEETVQAFARAASCSGKPARSDLPDRNRSDASRLIVERQTACRGARVQLVRVQGGGHFLPMQGPRRSAARGQNRDATTTGMVTTFFGL
jgi:poly(3-hydroxybutyrate) depolymerase